MTVQMSIHNLDYIKSSLQVRRMLELLTKVVATIGD